MLSRAFNTSLSLPLLLPKMAISAASNPRIIIFTGNPSVTLKLYVDPSIIFRSMGQLATAHARPAVASSQACMSLRYPIKCSQEVVQAGYGSSKVEQVCRNETSAL